MDVLQTRLSYCKICGSQNGVFGDSSLLEYDAASSGQQLPWSQWLPNPIVLPYEDESNESLNYFLSRNLLNTKGTQWFHFSMQSPLRSIQVRRAAISFTVTRRFSFTMSSTAAMAFGVTTRCVWLGRGEYVTVLMAFMNFLVHSYTCCSDRHASPYWTFIRRWISMGFTPSLIKKLKKNGLQNAVLLWCMLQAGSSSLHHYCAVVLHSCIVLPPVGHSLNHQYHFCQFTRQSSCVPNFYRTFKVFIWLSFVYNH